MLLIIEALLLILAALGQDHRAAAVEGQPFPLNMATNSVDDQYEGCRENMANQVEKEYLIKERKNSEFNLAWRKGETRFKKPEDKLTKNHLIAIYVYTDSQVFKDFNNDARSGKQNYKDKLYKWYSLHFLLTDAIQILKQQNKCIKTYRGTKVKFNEDVKNHEVRFGSFASSSLNNERAKFFGTVSCFEIHTCEGADVTKYSKLKREQEVLIPPYEKFKVIDVKTKGQEGAWCDTVFTLESTGRKSDLNCALSKSTKSIRAQN
ncbi:T-cell ecto-ADP-ribosyltransferase 1-like [Sinocyclocheilus rhinocerous]|uniref:T-cell ecto-ADP-ribosyltransferase 1-like n=1 Tax=Sinocyclocheilus rhinocerous TaxID=307959 RepID=UPI0007B966E6|nr:PREDICTED: T-cell ecto-ADP-ribosyltransferase 1-like [Sinocyclocheilus rhinocerous]